MPRPKPHLKLLAHCAALRVMLGNYLRLAASAVGQWRLMFEARAATVEKELAEVCDDQSAVRGEVS